MIHTIYCNVYEGLEAALVENVFQDLEAMAGDPSRIFEKIEIIPASQAIEDRLARSLADKFSILPGIRFCSIFDWLKPFMGATFRPGSIGTSLDWQIWNILKNPKFFEELKATVPETSYARLETFLHRNAEPELRNINLIEFCYQMSRLYATYGSFRMDWLLNWIDEKSFPLPADKALAMKEQPDYYWQKNLWERVAKAGKTKDLHNLLKIKDTLQHFHFEPKDKGKSLHFFMPFSLPPILLPFLKAFAEDKNAPQLWLYIMNPCAEYWFESMPIELFDWSSKEDWDEKAQKFLTANSPSTRAMIDRLYRFLNVDNGEVIETDAIEEQEVPKPTKPAIKRNRARIEDLSKKFDPLSPELKLFTSEDVQAYYFQQPQDSYLHKFQNSILFMDSSKLPTEADPSDESLKVFKAPSFPREIEGVIDWIHYRLSSENKDGEKKLNLSDIAVIVPDIEKATPAIEAVMGALPNNLRLPYKIIGNSIADTYLSLAAILGFGKLLNSRFNAADLEEWLELPINLERWDLSLSDISVLSTWLKAAGFRFGLSQEHLKDLNLDASDGTLDQAVERLTMGYFINPIEKNTFGDVLPVFGDEKGGFDLVTDGRGKLFKTIVALSESLEETRKELFKDDGLKTPQEWHKIISGWLNQYFVTNETPQEILSFRSSLQRLSGAMQEGLAEGTKVPFSVIWNVIETHLRNSPSLSKPTGSITFSSVQELRGLPFKVIALCGFDENSGFPGSSSHQEFDLMGVDQLKRRADRDSREDNKARFLDILLAARKNLVISYTVGTDPVTETNPSSVVQNFKNYFLSNALTGEKGKDKAKELWESVEVKLPLNSFSEKNFKKTSSRSWLSPNSSMLQSILKARSANYSLPLPAIGGTPIPDTSLGLSIVHKGSLSASELIKFLSDPDKYVLKKHKLDIYSGQEEEEFSWLAPNDALSLTLRKRKYLRELEEGYSDDELTRQRSLDPLNGIKDVRLSSTNDAWSNAEIVHAKKLEKIKKFKLFPATEGIILKFDEPSCRITQVTDSPLEVYTDHQNRYVIFDDNSSASQTDRLELRANIWTAAKKPTMVMSLVTDPKTEAAQEDYFLLALDHLPDVIFEENKEDVKQMVRLFDLSRRFSLGLTQEKTQTLLWTGFDHTAACACSKPIWAKLFPNSKNSKKTATDVGRFLEEDIDELQQVIESQILKEGR